MVTQNCVVLQRPGHGIDDAVVPQVLRDGVQRLDAAGVLVLVIPLLQLLEECFFVLRGVGDIVHTRQRLVQLRDLTFTVPASRRKVWKLAQGTSLSAKKALAICSAAWRSQAMKST